MNILLSSAGRRPYLVRWFREALQANGVAGCVIAADLDRNSPARAFADDFVVAPRVDDHGYGDWLSALLEERSIEMAISVNDFELSKWATLPDVDKWRPLIRLSAETQQLVEDKAAMSTTLAEHGVMAPATWLASHPGLETLPGPFVMKGRYGSGSKGLRFATKERLMRAITEALPEVTTRQGVPAVRQTDVAPHDLLVVQEQILGVEYGLDVVCDLEGHYAGVLARKKIAMRAGETDRSVSVDPAAFVELARGIAHAVPHPGMVDVDVIVDPDGRTFVIDINPRFGGGYPLSHVAGANVPAAYVAWHSGQRVEPIWLTASPLVVGAKYVEITAVPRR